MVAFPPPPVTLRQRSSTFAEPLCSLRRVLASGCHSFLFEWLEKVSQPSLAEPFGSDKGVIESTAACLFSLSDVTVRLPSLSRSRRPQPSRQEGLYSWLIFRSNFSVFYFLVFGVNAKVLVMRRRSYAPQLPFPCRLCILFSARRNPSNHLSFVAARCVRASAARFD